MAFTSSFEVALPGHFSRSRILAVLLPSRATVDFLTAGLVRALDAFLDFLALRADWPWRAQHWRDVAYVRRKLSLLPSGCVLTLLLRGNTSRGAQQIPSLLIISIH